MAAAQHSQGQPKTDVISRYERGSARDMLRQIHEGLRRPYYDPKFHGVDMDKRYKVFDQRLKQVHSLGHD
ncbi:MAG: hypothetical protein ACRD1Y_00555 [Terriglobales bacterium]